MKKEIHVDIAPDGSLTVEASGFSGKACLKATAELEQALGTVTERRRKSEFYRPQRRTRSLRNRASRE